MAGTLRELASLLAESRGGILPSIQPFPPLKVDDIATALDLESRAREASELYRRNPEDQSADETEMVIRSEVERRARKAAEEYQTQLDLYGSRIQRALSATDQRAQIEAAGANALTDFEVQAIDDLNHLHLARREVEGRQQEFDAFREQHHLSRLPNILTATQRQTRVLVLAIIMVLESAINGVLFSKGSETGVVGGTLQAILLSFFNVGAACLYARFGFPLLFHASAALKAIGVVLTVTFAAWCLALNFLIAHFRDIYIHHEGAVPVAALISRISTAPLTLEDSTSWILAALGVGLALLALRKLCTDHNAASMDHPHDGCRHAIGPWGGVLAIARTART